MSLSPLYIRIGDSKEVFGISRWTIYRLVSEGHITLYKRGGSAWVKVSEVSAYIEAGAVPAPDPDRTASPTGKKPGGR